MIDTSFEIKIKYQDDDLLVIDKPPGLVVDKNNTQNTPSLEEIIRDKFNINIERSGIVHRLDKDTSGLLIIAKNVESLENLRGQFKARIVEKEYIALIHGNLEKEVVVNAPIDRNPFNREKFIVHREGKEAQTYFYPIKHLVLSDQKLNQIFTGFSKIQLRKIQSNRYAEFTLVKCLPKTGRTHQIRVHLKYLGFSIVGDDKYGGKKTARLDHRFCARQFLHAKALSFVHPKTNKRQTLRSPLPIDLEVVLANLEESDQRKEKTSKF